MVMSPSDDRSLEHRRVLITGGSRGLGRGIAEAMSAAGAKVALVSRTRSQVDQAAAAIQNASAHAFDVSNVGAIPALIDEVEESLGGALTTVVHAAGIQHRQRAEQFDLAEFRRVIDVNLIAPFALSQEIARRQLDRETEGQHIFIGSLTSFISMPEIAAYGASKSGVFGLVRSLNSEWSARGIRVNGLAPGYIRTELTEAVFANEDRRAANLARIPMGQFGTPDDIGSVAVFLASDASRYVGGHMIPVDGGWLAA